MNLPRMKSDWSERQQVLAVILVAAAVLFLLWFFLLAPLNLRRRGLESQIEQMKRHLAEKNFLIGEDALDERKRAEQEQYNRYYAEWSNMTARLSTSVGEEEGEGDATIIDYKVKLFEVKQRLVRKSRQLRISLPRDLGLDDAVHSNEDARKLMYQLSALEKLVDMFLDLKISSLRDIQPLAPRAIGIGKEREPYIEEYPIAIEFYGTLEHLYALFHALYGRQHVFVLRHARVEELSPTNEKMLRVEAEICALVFLKEPAALTAPVELKTVYRRPLGI